jgi:outer membrane protein assembly factor BamA
MVFLLLFFILSFSPAIVGAQESQPPDSSVARLDSFSFTRKNIVALVVQGNRRTKSEIILREMFTQVGDSLDTDLVEADRKRIQNLGLFTRVEIKPLYVEKGVLLVINVTESWYFFPVPLIFYSDNDVEKLSYGLAVVHLNFRGRAEQLQFAGWLGYNPGVQLSYHNPWMFGSAQLFMSTRFYYVQQRNKSLELLNRDVDEQQVGFSWTIGKRLSKRTFVSTTLGYRQLKLDPPVKGETLSTSGHDRLPEMGMGFLYDARDLREYPRQGKSVGLYARRVGFGDPDIHYWRYGADLRFYQPVIGGLSFCMRAVGDFAAGDLPIYDRVFFGFANRIRGFYNREIEGENLLFGSAELRVPLLPIRYLNLFPRLLGQYGRNLKYGVSFALFVDSGRTWFDGENVSTLDFLTGYGASLDLHLPYIDVLRLALAWNEEDRRERIVIFGVSF